jgi:predicted acylesterase/phospholipase RssA/CRP-like cAMP-binding protein
VDDRPFDESPIQHVQPSRDPSELLAATPLFGGLPPADIEALSTLCYRRDIEAGSWCLREGELGDELFLLVGGRLRVYIGEEPVGMIRAGEIFGEIALLTGRARTSSVKAIRDSELLVLRADAFNNLVEQRPELLRQVAHVVVDRLFAAERPVVGPDPLLAMAAVPLTTDSALVDEVLGGLFKAFTSYGPTLLARSEDAPASDQRSAWAHALELAHQCVVYRADPTDPEWFAWCLRQSDQILLLAEAEAPAGRAATAIIDKVVATAPLIPIHLVLIHHSATRTPRGTRTWLRSLPATGDDLRWHHVRRRRPSDLARVARLVSGRGCGLVLGGGGARGLAHLGVMRALDEMGVPVDAVGGTSIGALIGSFRALDLDNAAIQREVVTGLVRSGFLFAPTFPLLALSSGRKIRQLLERAAHGDMGEMDVEDCWLHYFCISASLTRADTIVHDRRPLATAVRASLSLPGLLPPVRHGEDLLLDGGLLNNLPIDVMRSHLSGGTVVAVDLGVDVEMRAPETYEETPSIRQLLSWRLRHMRAGERVPGIISVLMRTKELAALSAERRRSAEHRADLHIRPPVAGSSLLDFRAAQNLVDIAYRTTMIQLNESEWGDRRW